MNDVRGLVVCVSYDDLLSVTLPRNLQHLDECLVITSSTDTRTQQLVNSIPRARLITTNAFYEDGANFNKGRALEQGFDLLGRHGWILVWDADILLPFHIPECRLETGNLYGVPRRILEDANQWDAHLVDWKSLPVRKEVGFPGYFHLFNAADPILQKLPWYGTDFTHAGGGDGLFQSRWPRKLKKHLPFEVLHLGPPDTNWFGRASERIDGKQDEAAKKNARTMEEFLRYKGWAGRKREKVKFRERITSDQTET